MANTFNRVDKQGTLAGSDILTVPAGVIWVVIGWTVSNIAGTLVTIDVDVAGSSYLKDIPLPAGSMLPILEGKLVLKAGETVTEKCSTEAGVDYILSYMEMS